MGENLSFDPSDSGEDKAGALGFEQAKKEGLLEQARRARDESDKYDEFGRERVFPVELEGIYKTGTMADKIAHRLEKGQSPLVLFTDIDNTFYNPDYDEESNRLAQVLEDNNWGLVYATGNPADILSRRPELPKADIVIGAVGTEIRVRQKDGSYVLDEGFRQTLGEGWKRTHVIDTSKAIANSDPNIMFQTGSDSAEVDEPHKEFKVSFWVTGDIKDSDKVIERFQSQLGDLQIIAVVDINDPTRYNIDVLPKNAGKVAAVRYITQKLGVFGPVAGDSGNDLDMLTESGQPAILVGNATSRTRESILLETGGEKVASFGTNVQKLPNGSRITLGRQGTDEAARGLINILRKGDINPEDARWFVSSLHALSKKNSKGK